MTNFEQTILIAVVLLNGYSLGANCVERFVNYQTWPWIPRVAFRAYHRAQGPLIRWFIVAPLAVGFLFQVLLLGFYRRLQIDGGVVWIMLMASMVGAISTVAIQIPIHRRFDAEGYSAELMRRLFSSDWIRKGADLVRLVATILLLREVIKA